MKILRCKNCGMVHEDTMRTSGKCPYCKSEDLKETKYWDWYGTDVPDMVLRKLWAYLSNIPINDNDEIDEEFIGFDVGIPTIDVWRWFDEHHSKGVGYLYKNTDIIKEMQTDMIIHLTEKENMEFDYVLSCCKDDIEDILRGGTENREFYENLRNGIDKLRQKLKGE